MDVTSIQYINGTNYISINYNDNFIHKYYAPFLPSNNNEVVLSGSEYNSEKHRLRHNNNIFYYFLLNKSKSFEWQVSLLFFINDTTLSSHMSQISEHINSSNHKIHSYDQMGKMIINLSNKTCENNNNFTGHINHIHKLLLISIVDTPEKDVSNVDRKVDKIKYVHQ